MDHQLKELSSILDQELVLYEQLIGLLQREKEMIIGLSLEDLHSCNNHKETILLKLNVLEDSRISNIQKLSDHFQMDIEELTLSKLSGLVEEPYRSSLEGFRVKMLSLVGSLREISQINQVLVERSLQSIRSFFSLLNLLGLSPQVYLPSGKIKTREGQGALLSRQG